MKGEQVATNQLIYTGKLRISTTGQTPIKSVYKDQATMLNGIVKRQWKGVLNNPDFVSYLKKIRYCGCGDSHFIERISIPNNSTRRNAYSFKVVLRNVTGFFL